MSVGLPTRLSGCRSAAAARLPSSDNNALARFVSVSDGAMALTLILGWSMLHFFGKVFHTACRRMKRLPDLNVGRRLPSCFKNGSGFLRPEERIDIVSRMQCVRSVEFWQVPLHLFHHTWPVPCKQQIVPFVWICCVVVEFLAAVGVANIAEAFCPQRVIAATVRCQSGSLTRC